VHLKDPVSNRAGMRGPYPSGCEPRRGIPGPEEATAFSKGAICERVAEDQLKTYIVRWVALEREVAVGWMTGSGYCGTRKTCEAYGSSGVAACVRGRVSRVARRGRVAERALVAGAGLGGWRGCGRNDGSARLVAVPGGHCNDSTMVNGDQ